MLVQSIILILIVLIVLIGTMFHWGWFMVGSILAVLFIICTQTLKFKDKKEHTKLGIKN